MDANATKSSGNVKDVGVAGFERGPRAIAKTSRGRGEGGTLEGVAGKQIMVVVCSTSPDKLDAVSRAFSGIGGIDARVEGVKAESGVSVYPFGGETIRGVMNRLKDAKKLHPEADVYVSIENGSFDEGGKQIDHGVVLVERNGKDAVTQIAITYSKGVEFPPGAIEEARQPAARPHLLWALRTDESRADILRDAVAHALMCVGFEQLRREEPRHP